MGKATDGMKTLAFLNNMVKLKTERMCSEKMWHQTGHRCNRTKEIDAKTCWKQKTGDEDDLSISVCLAHSDA